MARSRALALRPSAPIIVLPSRRGGFSRRRSRGISRRSRSGFGRHRSKGISSALAMPVALGGVVVGWLGAKGHLSKLPAIGGSRMTTLGIAGFIAMKYAKNRTIKAAGLAALATAAFDFGRTQGGGQALAGYGEGTEGDDAEGDDY